MIIHRSNRAEALIEALADVVDTPCGGVFEPELLVVQGQGMERWIAMELAWRRGVWANQRVLTLRGLVSDIALRVLEADIDPVFDPETLLWSIADALHALESRPEFASIANYLADDHDGRRRIQLSHQIANTFYRYMGYREEMLAAWLDPGSASPDEREAPDVAWQAALWRELVRRHGDGHLSGRGRALIDRLRRGEFDAEVLPPRLSVFGVSSLPRLHLDLLRALARHCDVHLFLLSPTPEYWGDVATDREARRSLQQGREREGKEEGEDLAVELHLDLGHPLLSTFGKLGRDFQALLVDAGDLDEGVGDLHAPPEGGGVLSALQSDVFALRAPGDDEALRRVIEPEDRSLRVHACHGPMREVEVLCEELVGCFEADPTLEPHDVVVMTPDIKSYAPYIEAVFGVRERGEAAAARGEGEIPYRIADRWPDPSDEVVDAFFAALDVATGRFAAPQVFDLLSRPCVARNFQLNVRDLETTEAWLDGAGIRWGVDAAHRVEAEQPETEANTWRFGLDRLLLGVALEADDATLFAGVQPFGEAEGQRADTLERLLTAERFLVTSREALSGAKTLPEWRATLTRFLAGLAIDDDDHHDQHLLLGNALGALAEQAKQAGFDREVCLASVREHLVRQLQHARHSTGFLTGGVTFCELVPMRSIPFRVVCLLGMNDSVFPRIDHPPGFDLMARNPKRGDRTTRDDDRFLFLEALLSARDRLVITYVGQSVRDGALLPPSAAVSELLDVVRDTFEIDHDGLRESVELRHPLHPHGSKYLGSLAERFPVHRALHRELAQLDVGDTEPERPFIAQARDEGAVALPGELPIDVLVDFYRAPLRAYLRDTLGVVLHDDREAIASREAFRLDPLERFDAGEQVLELIEAGRGSEETFEVLCATGALPHGVSGRLAFEDLWRDAEQIAAWNAKLQVDPRPSSEVFRFECGGTTLTGRFASVFEGGQVFSSFGRLGRASEFAAWVWHLAWQVCAVRQPDAVPKAAPQTVVVGRPAEKSSIYAVRFAAVGDAEDRLAALVARYRDGMLAPLPLFRESSRAFAAAHAKGGDAAAAKAARDKFKVDRFKAFGDETDPYVELVFRGVDPLDPDAKLAFEGSFGELALEVYTPLLEAREELA